MNIFENEFITINKIYTVERYENKTTDPKLQKFGNYFPTHELVFFLSGENNTVVDRVEMHDRPNFLRYMPKGQSRSDYTVSTISPSVCIDVYFDSSSPVFEHAVGMADMPVLRDKFLKLYEVWDKKQYGYYSKAMMIFYDIIHNIQLKDNSYVPEVRRQSVDKAYKYISENYRMHDFDYECLCGICGLKHTQFNNMFKKVYNVTPVQLVTKMRIEYAKELLVTSHYTMAEIAELCGFDNQYYFSSVFKKLTGFSPSKYKFD